ncbi:MAG: peptidyl-prolyl cis-trans isomerase [Lysinibacillus sp.]
MSSTRKPARKITPATPGQTPLSQRRLKTKPVLALVAILLLGNVLWFTAWLIPNEGDMIGGDEKVAVVDGDVITRQQWMAAIEERYGKQTLQNLVNEAVMEKAAKKYKFKVSDEEIDLELALMRSAQDGMDTATQNLSVEQLRQKIRSQLILDKVLTKSIVVEEKMVKKYYNENKSLYNIPTSYRTNVIEVATKKEAEAAQKNLKSGSDFAVLAREISVDRVSASLGGDIGFVTAQQENIDAAIVNTAKALKVGDVSKVISLGNGHYALVQVQEVIKGQAFTYDEVKEHIERELSIEQLPQSVTPEVFWSEFNATWYYGKDEK